MQAEAKTERIISIDFLRGLTVAFMIFVNSPGSWDYVCPWFAHAKWNGCTPTDLVFPFFLFIVGLSVHFSLLPYQSAPKTLHLLFKITKRAFLLFFIGVLLNGFPYYHLETLRVPGVLQRIAIVFFVCAITFLYTSRRFQIGLIVLLLLVYWYLLTFFPVPGTGISTMEPGSNLAAWLDHQLLHDHVWSQTKPWDPEGVLSTIPSIASGLIGVITAYLINTSEDKRTKTIHLFILANAFLLVGAAWNAFFPFNKNLWTSSYVLFTSGIAIHALAIGYWVIDISARKGFTKPFIAFGSNAITAYIISEIVEACLNIIPLGEGVTLKSWVFEHAYASWLNPFAASHLMALTFVLLVYIPVYVLYKKRILIKI
jgi:predicted acyltransferase